jgi:BirA family biotin operon repressor/biotin-[acetyl-CoA-carboxylase] ligase
MRGMTHKLSPERIFALCNGAVRQAGVGIEVVAETGSTNADLLASIGSLTAPRLLVAERQTAGRGRAGRSWHSTPGASLTFSLAWQFDRPIHALVGLPLAVGVALAESLAKFDVTARLKWPNDVLVDGRKLAGILIETASVGAGAQQRNWAVIGIGVNLAVDSALAARIDRPVAALPWLAETDQDALMATLLNGLAEALAQFEKDGFQAFMQRWNALHGYAGEKVVILDRGQVLHQGTAVGVDAIGRFMLDSAGERIAVMAGDVSLRAAED